MKKYFKNPYFGIKFVLFLTSIFFGLSQNISEIENSKFPITFTLYNGNILLLTNSSIIFYNSFFNTTLKKYNLDVSAIKNVEDSYRTKICQYPKEYDSYVLLMVKDHLKIFKENGEKIIEKSLDEKFQNFPLYDIVPIKVNQNKEFYYILAFTKSDGFTLNLYYYKVNTQEDKNTQVNGKIYNLSQFNPGEQISFVTNLTCQVFKNETDYNILICFYATQYPNKMKMVSFDIEGGLSPINSMNISKNCSPLINFVKSISNEERSRILTCFWGCENAGYCIIYDLKNNTLSEPIQYAGHVGSFITNLNLYFFKQTEQYILLSKSNNDFEAVIFDKNFETNSSKISIQFSNDCQINERETLIYSAQNKTYYLLADVFSYGKYSIRYMQTNISSYMIYNNNTDTNTNANTKTNSNIIILTGNKCSKSNETSEKLNLCIECNKQEKYYPVYYSQKNILLQGFTECFNNETKLINFFFNQKEERYEPCYETCRTCNYGGNATINNCTSCDFDGTFRPYPIGTTNCVKECRYRYYMTPYGQYKCSKDNQCNDVARLYIFL